MVVRSRRATPLTAIAAGAFRVSGVIQPFMHNAVLDRDKMAVIGVHVLFRGPTEITMVEDVVIAVLCAYRVRFDEIVVGVQSAYTETEIADNEVS